MSQFQNELSLVSVHTSLIVCLTKQEVTATPILLNKFKHTAFLYYFMQSPSRFGYSEGLCTQFKQVLITKYT